MSGMFVGIEEYFFVQLDLNDLPDRERAAAMAMNGSSSGGAYNITYRSGGDSSQAGRGLGSAAPSRSYVPGAAPMGDSGGASSEKSKKNRIKTLEKVETVALDKRCIHSCFSSYLIFYACCL